MNFLGWLTRKPKRLQPEAQWTVSLNEAEVLVADHECNVRTIAKGDLSGVAIETNDTGPWGADVWWLLFGADDQLACAFPQGATGEQTLLDYFTGLQGFDHSEMIKAMGSTQNAVFPVWRKAS